MSVERFVPADLLDLYEVHDWRNGLAVLKGANPDEWADIETVLRAFRLHHTEIATPGGRKSLIADRIDNGFKARGWKEKRFRTQIVVDDGLLDPRRERPPVDSPFQRGAPCPILGRLLLMRPEGSFIYSVKLTEMCDSVVDCPLRKIAPADKRGCATPVLARVAMPAHQRDALKAG